MNESTRVVMAQRLLIGRHMKLLAGSLLLLLFGCGSQSGLENNSKLHCFGPGAEDGVGVS